MTSDICPDNITIMSFLIICESDKQTWKKTKDFHKRIFKIKEFPGKPWDRHLNFVFFLEITNQFEEFKCQSIEMVQFLAKILTVERRNGFSSRTHCIETKFPIFKAEILTCCATLSTPGDQ